MGIERVLATSVLLASAGWANAQADYVNWENHPIHAADLSPSGALLVVTNTPDARIQFFDVSTGLPVFAGSVPTGLDPVAARFRSDDEVWVVNHISDSISIIDVPGRRVKATIATLDEPFDVVFAGDPERAFVSCSQVNKILVFDPSDLGAAPQVVDIEAEDPRALAVSTDRRSVYAAIFESGNGSTVVAGATALGDYPPNAAADAANPYGGANPPPNDGSGFSPALNPVLPVAPRVAQIVRKDASGRWLDDNEGDWTAFVSGNLAARSGRVGGWDLPDRDIAVIDADTLSVGYVSRLTNIGMALSVNPQNGDVLLVGTDATNEVRFEPNLTGTFLRVQSVRVEPGGQITVTDLNPHLDYSNSSVPQAQRDLSLGDPRAVAWLADGSAAFAVGMGSNNVVVLEADGSRRVEAPPIEVGEGPVGIVVSVDQTRLFVWNHFGAELSVVDVASGAELARVAAHDPLPPAVRDGRRHFYDTHATSGLGHLACASCHIDGRTDRLGWDLGDPSGDSKAFNQNCSSNQVMGPCISFHPLKGPMTTQTLQDIIGNEPFHWRGDRDGLEEFNPAFVGLLGDERLLTAGEMQEFEDFLATITLPPNPNRGFDNRLSSAVPLDGHVTSGRFGSPGQPLGVGDAVRGRNLFLNERLALLPTFPPQVSTSCGGCHSVPTGMGSNGRLTDPFDGTLIGGQNLATGPNGENHLHVTGTSTLTDSTFKVAQLRNLHEKTGFDMSTTESLAGFGFLHDGSVDTLAEFVSLDEFGPESAQDVADLIAFLVSFSGSELGSQNAGHLGQVPLSQDTHAAVGQQAMASSPAVPVRVAEMLALADDNRIDVVAHQSTGSWAYRSGRFASDAGGADIVLDALVALADAADPLTFMAVPLGSGTRLGLDRDGDGVPNGVEKAQGSNPADAASNVFVPAQGLWYNVARQGHGIDLQRAAGNVLAGTWYTYRDDGTPIWYQAVGEYTGQSWSADLLSYRLDADGALVGTVVGTMEFVFDDPSHATFNWSLGERSGSEPFERFFFAGGRTLRQYSGLWFDPAEPGYGLSIDTLGDVRVVVAYFYDADNEPRWAIGQSANGPSNDVDLLSVNGFCPDCPFVQTEISSGGTLALSFDEILRRTALTLEADYPALEGSLFGRTTELVPLTDPPINLEM